MQRRIKTSSVVCGTVGRWRLMWLCRETIYTLIFSASEVSKSFVTEWYLSEQSKRIYHTYPYFSSAAIRLNISQNAWMLLIYESWVRDNKEAYCPGRYPRRDKPTFISCLLLVFSIWDNLFHAPNHRSSQI